LTATITDTSATVQQLTKKLEGAEAELEYQRASFEKQLESVAANLECEQKAHLESKNSLLSKIKEYEISVSSLQDTVNKYTSAMSNIEQQMEASAQKVRQDFAELLAKYNIVLSEKEKLAVCLTEKVSDKVPLIF
jgi:hypothetical protein